MRTDFSTLKTLAVYTIDLLKENEVIEFDIDKRSELVEAMATEYGVSLATDEDIRDQAIEAIEDRMGPDNLPDNITESEMFNHVRKEIIKSFSGEKISGLYLVESLNKTANRISKFLMDSNLIQDVYRSDDDIVVFLVKNIRAFSVAPKPM